MKQLFVFGLGALTLGFMSAQFVIPSGIDNAFQIIQRIIVTTTGTSSGDVVLDINTGAYNVYLNPTYLPITNPYSGDLVLTLDSSGFVSFTTGANVTHITNVVGGDSPWETGSGGRGSVQVIGDGSNQALGAYSLVGGQNNIAVGSHDVVVGGTQNISSNSIIGHNFIGGGNENTINNGAGGWSFIGGGRNNSLHNASLSFIGGGDRHNIYSSPGSFIGGGKTNTIIEGFRNTIVGGSTNQIATGMVVSNIGGGYMNNIFRMGTIPGRRLYPSTDCLNTFLCDTSAIGGGRMNIIYGEFGVIAGGVENITTGSRNAILGGNGNSIYGVANSIVGGSNQNISGFHSFIAGGESNSIEANLAFIGGGGSGEVDLSFIPGRPTLSLPGNYTRSNLSVINGGAGNMISHDIDGALAEVIGGGIGNTIEDSRLSVIAGGLGHDIISSPGSFIGGGFELIMINGMFNTMVGGSNNYILSGAVYSSIIGGTENQIIGDGSISYNSMHNIIGGGDSNTITIGHGPSMYNIIGMGNRNLIIDGVYNIIGGGRDNTITQGSVYSSDGYNIIAGGVSNSIDEGILNIIAGGVRNTIQQGSENSFIGGGGDNVVVAATSASILGSQNTVSGTGSVAIGFNNDATADRSFALGRGAHAIHPNTFIWNDGSVWPFTSSQANTFIINASNGVGINTNNPQKELHIGGELQIDTISTGDTRDYILVENNGVVRKVGPASIRATESYIQEAEIVITSADILDIHNTPITLLTPSSSDHYIQVLDVIWKYHHETTAYTGSNPHGLDTFYISYDGGPYSELNKIFSRMAPLHSVYQTGNILCTNCDTSYNPGNSTPLPGPGEPLVLSFYSTRSNIFTSGDGYFTIKILYREHSF